MIYQTIGLIIGVVFYLFMVIHPLIPKFRKRLVKYDVVLFDASNYIEQYILSKSKNDKEYAIILYVLFNVLLSFATSFLIIIFWPLLILVIIGIYIIKKQINN
jgi:uncharacterized protein (UPF0333 family)